MHTGPQTGATGAATPDPAAPPAEAPPPRSGPSAATAVSGTLSATWRPRLRAEVRLAEDPARGTVVSDPVTRFGLCLDEGWEPRLLALLDGTRTLAEALDALERAVDDRSAAAARAAGPVLLKSLRYLRLTDDADRAALTRIRVAFEHPAETARGAPLRALPDARFECGSCGMCCRSFTLGPLDPMDLATLERLPLEESFPILASRPPLRAVRDGGAGGSAGGGADGGAEAREGGGDGDDGALFFLNMQDDGRCVFLDDDGLCGLHKRFGAEAKPSFCRLFPHEAYRTPHAVYVVDNAGCATYGEAAFRGSLLRDQVARSPALFRRAAAFGAPFHKTVTIDGGLAYDAELGFALELELTAVAEHPRGTVRDALPALRGAVEAFREALLAADDGALSAEAVFARAAALPPAAAFARAEAAPVDRARGLAALADLLDRFAAAGERARRATAQLDAETGVTRAWSGHAVLAAAAAAAALARAEAAGQAPGPGSAAASAAAVALDLADPAVDRRLRRLVRDLVFARGLATAPTVRAGVSGLALTLALITTGARLVAASRGAAAASQADLDRAQSQTIQLLASGEVRLETLSGREAAHAYQSLTVL